MTNMRSDVVAYRAKVATRADRANPGQHDINRVRLETLDNLADYLAAEMDRREAVEQTWADKRQAAADLLAKMRRLVETLPKAEWQNRALLELIHDAARALSYDVTVRTNVD